ALFLPKGEITEIVSHEQALAQCRHYIEENYPNILMRPVKSTAHAVELAAAEDSTIGAIGSVRAGEVFGLTPAAIAINDTANNSTRFVVLARDGTQPSGANVKTSIVCQINGQKPGSLYDLLYEFKKHNVNLTRIESRPARTALGEYIFFFDLEGTPAEDNIREAFQAIQKNSSWFKHLGSYTIEQI
ncbi:MAG: prephenate dehydratase, partial [Selenomonadales bacterium]|nr:prephenate dehydratase [Selenomonadales bacterium]